MPERAEYMPRPMCPSATDTSPACRTGRRSQPDPDAAVGFPTSSAGSSRT